MKNLLFICALLFVQNGYAQKKLEPTEIFEKCQESVVTIYIYKNNQVIGSASGVYLGNKMLATNYHVYKAFLDAKADFIYIKNKDIFLPISDVICSWQKVDLIIFQTDHGLKPIQLSSRVLKVGEQVHTISTPANEIGSVSLTENNFNPNGSISSIIPLNGTNIPESFIVTNQFTHGSSGGALIDDYGQLVGILVSGDTSADGARANINLVIPVLFLEYLIKNNSDCNLKTSIQTNTQNSSKQIIIEPKGLEPNPGEPVID